MTEAHIQSFKQGGTSTQEPKLHLLPLLTPSRDVLHSSSPPLHLLPKWKLPQERIAFQTSSKYGTTNWVESSHVFPSAYPRFEAGQTPKISSEEVATHLAKDLASRKQPQLWTLAHRIVPVRPCTEGGMSILPEGRGVTLVVTQIAKLDKKEWEHVIHKAVLELESKGKKHIEEIWLLVGGLLEEARSYEDSIRDVEQFTHFYVPAPTSKDEMRRYGPQWPACTLGKQRENIGKKGRMLIGLGHVCPAKLDLFDGMIAAYTGREKGGKTIADELVALGQGPEQKMIIPDTRL
ncbi:uncharacterized protein FA14DRAFT_185649 [Meira miltonrushii]|uniref:Uncharacterized protein n=1 Tax=Meira miltonrushii TaxID=1280837 RepID=A0A316VAR6_9BASI|nr:uncharacterized protein FA14DRAFT_185649 [Meira miltonrushii]PWN32625.1 hypothetical protein FA14DRAFT_185649 [Meira miltonrushii]